MQITDVPTRMRSVRAAICASITSGPGIARSETEMVLSDEYRIEAQFLGQDCVIHIIPPGIGRGLLQIGALARTSNH